MTRSPFLTANQSLSGPWPFRQRDEPGRRRRSCLDPKGLVANAKNFLDETDQFIENCHLANELVSDKENQNPIYLIGNPVHRLGFMVASPDDPLGFENPAEAVSELGQMRKDAGSHLKLYRVVPVEEPIVTRAEISNSITPKTTSRTLSSDWWKNT